MVSSVSSIARGGDRALDADNAPLCRLDPLPQAFFNPEAPDVARAMVGRTLVRIVNGVELRGVVVEAEAYMPTDPASHAYRGKTPRNAVMFGPAGRLYVYRSYGVHWCANIVTGPCDFGAAVLLRAVQPQAGVREMQARRGVTELRRLCRGPGNLARAFAFTGADCGLPCTGPELYLSVQQRDVVVIASARIGVGAGRETLWRFTSAGSRFVSGPRREAPVTQ